MRAYLTVDIICGLTVVLLLAGPLACQPRSGTDTDAGTDADAGADATDTDPFPDPEVCEAVCDHVYNECGFEFPEDDRMPYNHQVCYNDCLYNAFDGAESCLRDAQCSRESVISCVRENPPAVENPCDRETPWPEAWVEYERKVIELTNERRAEGATCAGEKFEPAPPLEMDPRLRCAARRHSKDMGERDYFAHESPDGETPSDRAAAADYPGRRVGENISGGRARAEKTVEGWMNSPGHCRNIMRPFYEHIGVGYVKNKGHQFDHLTTQMFGDPQ